MACKSTKYVGRTVVLDYAIGCGDALPADADWERFGSLRTKEFNLQWETTDATADDSISALRENLATFQTLEISGDGVCKASGTGSAALIELTKHVANPAATAGQPVAWMRMTFPDITFTAFMLISSLARSAPYDDVVTFSLAASATTSDFGLIVEDTPGDADIPVTDVVAIPLTKIMSVGNTFTMQAVVVPAEAIQDVTWASSDTDVATVNAITGVVTAVAAGTANITATSTSDPTKSGSCALTVS